MPASHAVLKVIWPLEQLGVAEYFSWDFCEMGNPDGDVSLLMLLLCWGGDDKGAKGELGEGGK